MLFTRPPLACQCLRYRLFQGPQTAVIYYIQYLDSLLTAKLKRNSSK